MTAIPDHPTRRRAKPAPFQRPSMDLTRHNREWRDVPATRLKAGDMVIDVPGTIVTVTAWTRDFESESVTLVLHTSTGAEVTIPSSDKVRAFVPVGDP